jgi:transcriptional regulator with XRE-family HTH domain
MTTAEVIKSIRREAAITQESLAREIDVTVRTVARWEFGSSVPDLDNIAALCLFARRNNLSPYEEKLKRATIEEIERRMRDKIAALKAAI